MDFQPYGCLRTDTGCFSAAACSATRAAMRSFLSLIDIRTALVPLFLGTFCASFLLVASEYGWRQGRATYYGAPGSFASNYDPSRGEGSFGILEYGRHLLPSARLTSHLETFDMNSRALHPCLNLQALAATLIFLKNLSHSQEIKLPHRRMEMPTIPGAVGAAIKCAARADWCSVS